MYVCVHVHISMEYSSTPYVGMMREQNGRKSDLGLHNNTKKYIFMCFYVHVHMYARMYVYTYICIVYMCTYVCTSQFACSA